MARIKLEIGIYNSNNNIEIIPARDIVTQRLTGCQKATQTFQRATDIGAIAASRFGNTDPFLTISTVRTAITDNRLGRRP
jgi:hypothetical protein